MTIIYRLMNYLLALAFTTSLIGCGVDTTELPPERPVGYVSGYAIDSAINNATVSIYSFANGVRGAPLGVGSTNSVGAFSVKIQAESQLVMVEITGGSYVEEASGVEVLLTDGQKLRSLVQYESGRLVNTNVTPLTHMATALAEYKVANGENPAQAMGEAFDVVDQFFALNIRGETSINITNDRPTPVSSLSDDVLYGFYMAGLSNWTRWISQQNNRSPHTIYSSISLAQIMYDDIRFDGLLDGVVLNSQNNEPLHLVLENVSLDATAYRLAFSLHVMAISNSAQNKTGISSDDTQLMDAMTRIAGLDETSQLLPEGATSIALEEQPIQVNVDETYFNAIYGRQYSFPIEIDSLVGAETIEVRLGSSDSAPVLVLDTMDASVASFDDISSYISSGENDIYVTARNIFNNSNTFQFTAMFDFDSPTITFDSEPYANSSVYILSGSFQDNISGLQSISVRLGDTPVQAEIVQSNDSATTGSWSAIVQDLVPSTNTLQVVVTDLVGNRNEVSYSVYLDDQEPEMVIGDVNGNHSMARYSQANGSFSENYLTSDDTTTPLYFDSDQTQFMGEVIPSNLDNQDIPYYRFTISDEKAPGVSAAATELTVEVQYEKLEASGQNQIMEAWRTIDSYRLCDQQANFCEYYLPLASPLLITAWHQTTPLETHILNVRVSDTTGNQAVAQFMFRADIFAPAIPVCSNQPCSNGELEVGELNSFNVDFAQRQTLYGKPLPVTSYTFRNPSNKSIYMRLADDSTHTTAQIIEQWRRNHEIQKTTSVRWQIRSMYTVSSECPPASSWNQVYYVYNYNGTEWQRINVPDPVQTTENILQDELLASSESGWMPVPHFDNQFKVAEVTDTSPPRIWTYTYDYTTSRPVLDTALAAYVSNWLYQQGGGTTTCNESERYYFQQNELYEYSLLQGPEDLVEELPMISEQFVTTGYDVNVNGATAQANSQGWYLVPEGATVSITKIVTAPLLDYYDSQFTSPASYTDPVFRDKSINWLINRHLEIFLVHNSGGDNIGDMSERANNSDAGISEFFLSRN